MRGGPRSVQRARSSEASTALVGGDDGDDGASSSSSLFFHSMQPLMGEEEDVLFAGRQWKWEGKRRARAEQIKREKGRSSNQGNLTRSTLLSENVVVFVIIIVVVVIFVESWLSCL